VDSFSKNSCYDDATVCCRHAVVTRNIAVKELLCTFWDPLFYNINMSMQSVHTQGSLSERSQRRYSYEILVPVVLGFTALISLPFDIKSCEAIPRVSIHQTEHKVRTTCPHRNLKKHLHLPGHS
jgi:hypothetical protein